MEKRRKIFCFKNKCDFLFALHFILASLPPKASPLNCARLGLFHKHNNNVLAVNQFVLVWFVFPTLSFTYF